MSNSTILQLTDDQLASQYAILFPEGIPGGGNTDNITLRLDQSFDPPERRVEKYDIVYRGLKTPKTSMTEATDKTFSVDIRVDQYWNVVKDLEAWLDLVHNPVNGTALPDVMTRTTILINHYDGSENVVKTYRFRSSKIDSLKIGTSDNASPDPLRATASFIFTDMISE